MPWQETAAQKPIKRRAVLATAEAYRQLRWKPTEANRFHGDDPDGIRVDTPDVDFIPINEIDPGWWEAGKDNIGMPYQWGGFSSIREFKKGLRKGLYAGDVYTREKRRQNLLRHYPVRLFPSRRLRAVRHGQPGACQNR